MKEPKRRKRHDKKVRKDFEPKSVEELDARQWLDEQFERMVRCYHEMKAKRDKEPG
jgi:hypothetical protein